MLFKKKVKEVKSKEQLEKEREERIESTMDGIQRKIIALNNKKETYAARVAEAKRKGFQTQEAQARKILGNCLATIQRMEKMLMTIELALSTRDLAQINTDFVRSLEDVSDDIIRSSRGLDTKKAKGKYTKALYYSEQQMTKMDDLLDAGEFVGVMDAGASNYAEFDDEIDRLVGAAERASVGSSGQSSDTLY